MKIRDIKFFDIEGPFEFFKKLRLGKSEKQKKNFVSDFDETQDFKSLCPRDFTHEI